MSFSKPPKPDTTEQDKAAAEARADRDKAKRENQAKLKVRRARTGGRQLLTTFGEQGIPGTSDTIGG